MEHDLGYLRTEYAREKMIESYRIEEKERKEKKWQELNDFLLDNITKLNEVYKKIHKEDK